MTAGNQPPDSAGNHTSARFSPRAKPPSHESLESDDEDTSSRDEEKRTKNLPATLESVRITLAKGRAIIDMGRQRFEEDWLVHDAAINVVIQLAESAKRLPQSYRSEKDEIAWRELIGMRNVLAHDYADVDLSTVWNVLRDEFPRIERVVVPGA